MLAPAIKASGNIDKPNKVTHTSCQLELKISQYTEKVYRPILATR